MSVMSMLVSGNTAAAAFSPSSLFAAGEQGVWYDPSDLTTMFEDAAGTTPVHTPGNGVADSPVGLLLDKRLGLVSSTKGGVGEGAAGQYFSTPYKSITTGDIDLKIRWSPIAFTAQSIFSQDNGTNRNFIFTVGSAKTLTINWWESAGTLRTATSTVAATLNAGTVYWLRCTVAFNNTTLVHTTTFYVNADTGNNTEPSSWTQLGSTVTQGGFVSNVRSLSCPTWVSCNFNTSSNILNGKVYFASAAATIGGSAVQTFTPTSYTSGSTFTSTSSDVWTINGTARIVPDGNHATQSTSTARPTLSARYNQLTATDTLSTQSVTTVATTYTLTFSGSGTITLSGTKTGVYTSGTSTLTGVTAGTLTLTVVGTVTNADLRVSNDGVGLPTYQSVTNANTYDSVGFPYYIKTDGVDDFLTAGTINFSGTNKMSAFAGARKTSANTISCLLELTADFAATNGGFGIFAPNNTNQYETESRGTAYQLTGTTSSAYASPVTNVVGALGDISAPSITLRLNGSQISTNTSSQGTGNYANAAFFMFRRNGAIYAFGGRAYGIIVRGASSTATEISNTETWLNGKTKAY